MQSLVFLDTTHGLSPLELQLNPIKTHTTNYIFTDSKSCPKLTIPIHRQ